MFFFFFSKSCGGFVWFSFLFVFKIVIHIGHGRKELFGVSHILQPIAQLEYNHLKEKKTNQSIISIHHTVK